jgi:hypothetical protein
MHAGPAIALAKQGYALLLEKPMAPNAEDCRFTAYRWHINAPVTFKEVAESGDT